MSAPLTIINPTDRDYTTHRYVLWFGACAPTFLMVYASSLDDALEECAEWLGDNARGLILLEGHGNDTRDEQLDELMADACKDAGLAWPVPDSVEFNSADMQPYWDAEETAYADLTRTERGFIPSDEWGIELNEYATRGDIKALIARLAERHYSDTPVVAIGK
jgi:hypothetical protein